MKNYIYTYTGKKFYFTDPQIEDIDIIDIAHSLSLQCRFNGHLPKFYSVAEHSWKISYRLPDEFALWGLLHDAAEAYISDVPHPVKCEIDTIEKIENRILEIICQKYNLIWPMPEIVKKVDGRMGTSEMLIMMNKEEKDYGNNKAFENIKFDCYLPYYIEQMFLIRFGGLIGSITL